MPLHIGFALFPGVTQLDFTGPHEVLSRLADARCDLLSHDDAPIACADGLRVLPSLSYADAGQLDIVCVPGGPGHLRAMQDAGLLGFLRAQAPGCRYVTSVCTGGMVLAAAGLLRGYRATTHWMSVPRLAAFGALPSDERVVLDRNRLTGGGVTAGIDFGLRLAAELQGEGTARAIQLQLQYAPAPPFDAGTPQTADAATLERAHAQAAAYKAAMEKADAAALAALAG